MLASSYRTSGAGAIASRVLRVVYQLPAFYVTLLLLGLVQLLWAIVAAVLWHLVPEQRGHIIGRAFVSKL